MRAAGPVVISRWGPAGVAGAGASPHGGKTRERRELSCPALLCSKHPVITSARSPRREGPGRGIPRPRTGRGGCNLPLITPQPAGRRGRLAGSPRVSLYQRRKRRVWFVFHPSSSPRPLFQPVKSVCPFEPPVRRLRRHTHTPAHAHTPAGYK